MARHGEWQCAPWVHSFRVGDALVLFDEKRQELHRLSEEAASAWEMLQVEKTSSHSKSREKAVAAIEARQQTLPAIIQMFLHLQLMVERSRVPPFEQGIARRDPGFSTTPYKGIQPANDGCPRRSYRVLGHDIAVTMPSEIEVGRIEAVLGHATSPSTGHGLTAVIDLVSTGGGYEVVCEGRVLDRCDDLDAIAPLVKAWVTQIAASRSPHMLGLHSAALAIDGAAVLLPAPSGTGKTTLALAGLHAGMQYLSDDLVLLSPDEPTVRPVVNALCLKEAGLPFIRRFVPHADELLKHRRPDGVVARYLCPRTPNGDPPADKWPVRAIFFPRQSDVTTATSLSHIEALDRLLANCCSVPCHLTCANVDLLIKLVVDSRAYDLEVSDPTEAIDKVISLCLGARPEAKIDFRKITHGI